MLTFLLSLLGVISSSIFIVDNLMYSVLLLILTFINSSFILFLIEADFLAFIFIIIYVGAIAILFLFVIMMINIKTSENTSSKAFKLFIILCGCCGLFLNQASFFSQTHNLLLWDSDLYLNFDSLLSFLTLSQLLFSFYYFSFLIAGLILLVAMIGAILLTINFNSDNKSQNICKQNSRVLYFFLIK